MSVKRISDRVTIKDVAAAVGVSVATISYAFNRPDQLSTALRKQILSKATQLGYRGANPVARNLRQQRTGSIGIIFDESLHYAFGDSAASLFLQGVAQATEKEDIGLLLVPCSKETGERSILNAAVDGFLVYGVPKNDRRVLAARRRHLPLVFVDHGDVSASSSITVGDRVGAGLAAAHLVELGHERVAVVSFRLWSNPRNQFVSLAEQQKASVWPSRERLLGYREGLSLSDRKWEKLVRVFQCVHSDAENGRIAARALIETGTKFSAVLVMSDIMAIGLMEELHRHNMKVPHDVSVVGFDDIPEAAIVSPALTTVHQDHREKGLQAGGKLIAALLKRTTPSATTVGEPYLVLRSSTSRG